MADFEKAFYTIPEAAQLLRVHENTLYNLVRKTKLDHYRIGNQIRTTAAELEKLYVPAEPDEK